MDIVHKDVQKRVSKMGPELRGQKLSKTWALQSMEGFDLWHPFHIGKACGTSALNVHSAQIIHQYIQEELMHCIQKAWINIQVCIKKKFLCSTAAIASVARCLH